MRRVATAHPAGGDHADADATALQPGVPRQQLRRAVEHRLRHAAASMLLLITVPLYLTAGVPFRAVEAVSSQSACKCI